MSLMYLRVYRDMNLLLLPFSHLNGVDNVNGYHFERILVAELYKVAMRD